ncbi:LysR family transcriptional regulator [Maribius pontilimi]|uniref:LysR family transcriptional regulator n=1 Tax=Palleronia pontilimi TaxID=1964209 RepID=A0A934IAZ7_9RHOB|nr:LysR family transcriptional regulator [Palleronia pontilimi]MBJ3763764.1 LysR family transcriptional regulator [Palleronia pontilimi]
MALNSEQIDAFLATVRLQGVGKAALALNLTQPAVTARIKKLEQSLGKDLFDRSASGMRLTKDGEVFLTYAERFEQLEGLIRRNVIDENELEGALRIGASETVAQCWLPEFVLRLHTRFPKLQIEINVDISVALRDALVDREIDLAFLLGPVSEYAVDNVALPGVSLGWYRACDLAPRGDGDAGFLHYPIMTYLRRTKPYREIRAAMLDRVGPGVRLFPSSSLSACFRMVEAGIGVAALPRALAAPYLQRGTICEFDPDCPLPALEFTASFGGEPRRHLSEIAAQIALEVATEHAAINDSDDTR